MLSQVIAFILLTILATIRISFQVGIYCVFDSVAVNITAFYYYPSMVVLTFRRLM